MRSNLRLSVARLLQQPSVWLSLLAALTTWFYLPTFGRNFVSEDFPLLRILSTEPFLAVLGDNLTGPWLRLIPVGFYRPLSTLLLQLEHLLFGVQPLGYGLLHFAVHLFNVYLVYRLADRSNEGKASMPALTCAFAFALFPLHPNTVVFIASFATLFCATFLLLACRWHLRALRTADPRASAATVLSLAIALGCYEQAAVLPALLLVHDVLKTITARQSVRVRPWIAHQLTLWVAVGVYLGLRRVVLEDAVAGYPGWVSRLTSETPLEVASGVLGGMSTLLYPAFEAPVLPVVKVMVSVLLAVMTGLAVATLHRGAFAFWWLLGLAWILLSQAPFMFSSVVPATGRYWYLTSIGVGFLLIALAHAGSWLTRLVPSSSAGALALLLGIVWLPLLRANVCASVEAGRLTTRIQSAVAAVDVPSGSAMFVAGCPEFVPAPGGAPMAQVFHWGLSDAVAPPFALQDARVYALKSLSIADFSNLAAIPNFSSLWVWSDDELRESPLSDAEQPEALVEIEAVPSEDAGTSPEYRFRGKSNLKYRLVTVTMRGAWTTDLQRNRGENPRTWSHIDVYSPDTVMMRRLYHAPVYWWVEGTTDDGNVAASSAPQIIPWP